MRKEAARLWTMCEALLLVSASSLPEISVQRAITPRERQFLQVLQQLHVAGTTGKDLVARQLTQDFTRCRRSLRR